MPKIHIYNIRCWGFGKRKRITLGMEATSISGCLGLNSNYTYSNRKWVKRRVCVLPNRIKKLIFSISPPIILKWGDWTKYSVYSHLIMVLSFKLASSLDHSFHSCFYQCHIMYLKQASFSNVTQRWWCYISCFCVVVNFTFRGYLNCFCHGLARIK